MLSVTLILLAEMPIVARESYVRGLKTISVCPFKVEVPYLAQIQIEIFIIHDSTDSDVTDLDLRINDLTSKWVDGPFRNVATGADLILNFAVTDKTLLQEQ